MKITDLLKLESIELDGKPSSKDEALRQMVDLMEKNGNVLEKDEYLKTVFAREAESTTGIGDGIAIPHGKTKAISKAGLAAMVVKDGVDFDSLDGEKVNLIFLIGAPDTSDNVHLEVLSRLSTLLMNPDFKTNLLAAKSKEEFLKVIEDAESEKLSEVKEEEKYEVLAITSCPTGIAHTYMAAEALVNAGKEMNHLVKVETHGASGVENAFTDEEIKNAKGIIIAADTKIDLARFDGMKLIKAHVADGISKSKELIEKVLSDDAPIYKHEGAKADVKSNNKDDEKITTKIYKHLMNGVTHMLPFVVGGGILIALAFMFDSAMFDKEEYLNIEVPKYVETVNEERIAKNEELITEDEAREILENEVNSNFGKNSKLGKVFKTIGEYAFGVMLYILAGYIAYSIADRPGLAVGFVGGIIAANGTSFNSVLDKGDAVSSGFLGALVAGFVGGYLVLGIKKLCTKLPKAIDGIKTILIYPVVGILLIGLFMFALNPLMASINTAINGWLAGMSGANKVLLGMILGGMMAVDLGGPVNKAAYAFATGMLASNTESAFAIMAAVMAGGMTPPIAIALLATFFPKKIAKKDRSAALTNYIMGLSFISEGAIPFAAQDPIRMIVSFIAGSAVAGGLSEWFGCLLRAPHGGLFVIPTVTHPWLYLLAIAIGSLVSMAILAMLKKDIKDDDEK